MKIQSFYPIFDNTKLNSRGLATETTKKSKAMIKNKPKYQIGTKVIVCKDLKTEIEKVEFSEKYQQHIYWFRDEKGKLCNEAEYAIESTTTENDCLKCQKTGLHD